MQIWNELTYDWSEKVVESPAHFSLLLFDEELLFAAKRSSPAILAPGSSKGDYFEGLWEYDVAELFIADSSGKYLEINLAPNGAWWAMGFVSPRVRDGSFVVPKGVTIESVIDESSWEASISIPKEELPFTIAVSYTHLTLPTILLV